MDSNPSYYHGFGNFIESEAIPGALPRGQNSPQHPPFDLYAEQLSGSAFTALRHQNKRTWLYRIRPSVMHGTFEPIAYPHWISAPLHNPTSSAANPNQMRWNPLPLPAESDDFLSGMTTYAVCGDLHSAYGCAAHLYVCNRSMVQTFFQNSDGDMLIIPQEGILKLHTELGILEVGPQQMALIPRGIKYSVHLQGTHARGYVCENYGAPFVLPELGPIGANGLANPRDFMIPHARFEKLTGSFQLINKYQGHFWKAALDHSPLDVVAWHGNYYPYLYDLTLFNTIGTVSYDHPDPSIFTVLTSPSAFHGTANVDFVIFPERWMVAEHTFRPPYYHRNIMSEFMGLITGFYDAKQHGFQPGGVSIHNAFTAHGPDRTAYLRAIQSTLKPEHYRGTLAFMFETRYAWQVTQSAYDSPARDLNYMDCWKDFPITEKL